MPRGSSRWTWLTVFAICNLAFWIAIAAAVGLAASSEIDLGVETFVREYRATAEVALKQSSFESPAPATKTSSAAKLPRATSPQAEALEPTSTVVWPDDPTPQPTARVRRTRAATQSATPRPTRQATQKSAPTLMPTQPPPTPVPSAAPISRPLLMADPELDNLAGIDQEMGRSAPGRPVQIRYKETALNREIAALVENNPDLPYKNVKIDLQRDRVVVTGDALLLGLWVSAKIVGQVVVSECRPQAEIESISMAGVMTPRFVKDQIKEMITEALDWYPEDYALCLEQIVLEEDRATIYGHRR